MNEHQQFEQGWWGSCANTYGEETKQLSYAYRMGLRSTSVDGHWPVYDLGASSVLDLGGGPTSMLLKTQTTGRRVVVDPCPYPEWVVVRYYANGIEYRRAPAETFDDAQVFDECWIYNVLQHVEQPALVARAAKSCARVVRVFEWIDFPPHMGHPHELKSATLDRWFGGTGTVEDMTGENGCHGRAWYGVF